MTGNANFDVDLTRLFNAPTELVYKAFTDPDQLARWYGPVGFSAPRDFVDIDARVGIGAAAVTLGSVQSSRLRTPVSCSATWCCRARS